jgi:ParB-like chromosome segregation protein Spo0J
MHDETRQPTEEELQAAFEEQMRNIRVEDVVLQTVATLVNLAGRRLGLAGEGEKDLEQAQLAIDAARALLPMCPEEQLEPIKQAMSQLQIAFARETQTSDQTSDLRPQTSGAQDEAAPKDDDDDARRAEARSKIWTPPGT